MKQLLSITALAMLLVTGTFAQSTFERTYNYGMGTSVCSLPNGEFITSTNYPMYGIAKMDANGNILSFTGIQNSTINSMRITNDGNLIYTGMQIGDGFAIVAKTDMSGNNIWTKSFAADGFSAYTAGVIAQADNTYLINMASNGGTTSSPYEIFKLDDSGTELWRNFPGDGYAATHSLMNTNNLVLDAYTTSVADEFGIITLAGIDNATGITQWTRTFYDPSLLIDNTYPGYSLAANGACLSSMNDIYMVGSKSLMTEPLVGTPFQFIMKTDDLGNVIWSKTFSEGSFNQIIETSDGCFVVTGKSATSTGILMMKFDSNGNSLWSQTFNQFTTSTGMDFHETGDQGFIISGFAYEDASHQYYTYVIKTDALGNVGNVSTIISKTNSAFKNATFAPTVLHERSTITIPAESISSGNKAMIVDVTGRILRQFRIDSETTTIERGTLASGAYSLLITNQDGSSANFKFIVE
ncbi:MAG: hypothetical protein IPL24_15240 [Bacteroidetes bacterium]|nr:hypothetical protein [Bacteroidota bacterium]